MTHQAFIMQEYHRAAIGTALSKESIEHRIDRLLELFKKCNDAFLRDVILTKADWFCVRLLRIKKSA